MNCNQCEMLSINGVACHETGCPNTDKQWDKNVEAWLDTYECPECGHIYTDDELMYSCCLAGMNEPYIEGPDYGRI